MRYDGIFEALRAEVASRYGEPILAAVMVHRSPDQPRGGPKLRTNNHLALTPTALRLCGLGGRTGVKVKGDIAAWDRRTALVEVFDAERSTWFNTTMSSYDYLVHRVRISGPEGTVVVDVMADNPFMDAAAEIQVLLAEMGRPAVA